MTPLLRLGSAALCAMALLTACSTPTGPPRLLVAVGDSITAGYMSVDGTVQLRQDLSYASKLGARWRVVNVAVPGFTTQQSLGWPLEVTSALAADAVVVMLGTNDALQNLPIEKSQASMRRLLDAYAKRPLVIVAPPFAGEPNRAWQSAWNDFLRAEAAQRKATFVDAYTPATNNEWLCALPDIHPCATGHEAMAKLVAAALPP